jgi:hypothetical protein
MKLAVTVEGTLIEFVSIKIVRNFLVLESNDLIFKLCFRIDRWEIARFVPSNGYKVEFYSNKILPLTGSVNTPLRAVEWFDFTTDEEIQKFSIQEILDESTDPEADSVPKFEYSSKFPGASCGLGFHLKLVMSDFNSNWFEETLSWAVGEDDSTRFLFNSVKRDDHGIFCDLLVNVQIFASTASGRSPEDLAQQILLQTRRDDSPLSMKLEEFVSDRKLIRKIEFMNFMSPSKCRNLQSHQNQISWQPPIADGCSSIVAYRIYEKTGDVYTLLAELLPRSSNVYSNTEKKRIAISAVNANLLESELILA